MKYLLKGLEGLSVWDADTALEDNPLHIKQHGFQEGKSTETAISNTIHKIEKHILNGEHCMGVFLDIQAAFDSIRMAMTKKSSCVISAVLAANRSFSFSVISWDIFCPIVCLQWNTALRLSARD